MILLDTHALVWWVADAKRLPAKARRALDAAVKLGLGATLVTADRRLRAYKPLATLWD